MTTPTDATTTDDNYVAPTHLTQVVVDKDIDFDKLTTEVRNLAADAEVSVVAFSPPPYSPQNVATLTVGTVGDGPSLDDLNGVVAKHKPSKNSTPAPAPAEPTVTADPAVQQNEQPSSQPAPDSQAQPAPAPEATP